MIAASGKLHLMFARIIRHIKHLNLNIPMMKMKALKLTGLMMGSEAFKGHFK